MNTCCYHTFLPGVLQKHPVIKIKTSLSEPHTREQVGKLSYLFFIMHMRIDLPMHECINATTCKLLKGAV